MSKKSICNYCKCEEPVNEKGLCSVCEKHTPQFCNVDGCKHEADYWIEVDYLHGETFYLCSDCACKLMNEDEEIIKLDTDTGEIIKYVVGKYACCNECEVCNEF